MQTPENLHANRVYKKYTYDTPFPLKIEDTRMRFYITYQ